MKIFSITPIAFAMLFLFIVISHMALQGDAVIVVMSKGLVRKPQAVSKKQSSSVVVAGKIRRNSKTAKGRNKRKWIKSWISRVLRSKVFMICTSSSLPSLQHNHDIKQHSSHDTQRILVQNSL